MGRGQTSKEHFDRVMGARRGYGDMKALLAGEENSAARATARQMRGLGAEAALIMLPSWKKKPASPLLAELRQDLLGQWVGLTAERPEVQVQVRDLMRHLGVRGEYAGHLLAGMKLIHITKELIPESFDKRGAVIAICGHDLGLAEI